MKYYRDLYNLKLDKETPQPSTQTIKSFLDSVTLPTLTADNLETLNAPISDKEILDTIKALPANKEPVKDGFTSEYYKAFSQTLVPHIGRLFSSFVSAANIPEEMLQATILTLPNQGRSRTPHKILDLSPC